MLELDSSEWESDASEFEPDDAVLELDVVEQEFGAAASVVDDDAYIEEGHFADDDTFPKSLEVVDIPTARARQINWKLIINNLEFSHNFNLNNNNGSGNTK